MLKPGLRLIVPDFHRDELTVSFMLAEMVRNASGQAAATISEAVQRSQTMSTGAAQARADMKKAAWYELFRIHGNVDLLNSYAQQAGVAMAEAQARWFLQVRAGGVWDHKPALQAMYLRMPSPPRPFGSMGRAFHFPIKGDLHHEYYYDIWSNIHYGFVGARCGFDEATLQTGAASGLPGAGDNDESDVISVRIGIQLWRKHGLSATGPAIRSAIVSQRDAYLAARSKEIRTGTPEDKASHVVIRNNDYK